MPGWFVLSLSCSDFSSCTLISPTSFLTHEQLDLDRPQELDFGKDVMVLLVNIESLDSWHKSLDQSHFEFHYLFKSINLFS